MINIVQRPNLSRSTKKYTDLERHGTLFTRVVAKLDDGPGGPTLKTVETF